MQIHKTEIARHLRSISHAASFRNRRGSKLATWLGSWFRRKIAIFERFCIPAPVIGGLIFAIISCVLYEAGVIEFAFDETMREVCMVFFFTCVGFMADLKSLKAGGKALVIFSLLIAVLITAQNMIAIGMSEVLGISPLAGLSAGSISLVGGHGTSGAFGPVLESMGFEGATTYCIAAATYGLVAGGLIGGPLGNSLIRRKDLLRTASDDNETAKTEIKVNIEYHINKYAPAVFHLIIAAGIGTVVSWLISRLGLTFPVYVGAMIAAIIGGVILDIMNSILITIFINIVG